MQINEKDALQIYSKPEKYEYKLVDRGDVPSILEESHKEKDLGVIVINNLKPST